MIKKTIILLFAILPLISYGQIDSDTLIHESELKQTILKTVPNYIDSCDNIGKANSTTVFIDNNAVSLIELNNNFNGNFIRIYENSQVQSPIITIPNPQQKFYINNLRINNEYIIKSVNKCGHETTIGKINTKYEVINSIGTHTYIYDADIYNHIASSVMHNQNTTTLYNNIIADTTIPYLKKLHFLQKHLNRGKKFDSNNIALPPLNNNSIYISAPIHFPPLQTLDEIFESLDDECLCKIVGTIELGKEDGVGTNSMGEIAPSFPKPPLYSHETYHVDHDGSKSKQWRSFSRMGASRYEQFWYHGTNLLNESTYSKYDGTDSNSLPPYFTKYRYILECRIDGYPESTCGCARDIDYTVQYLTHLFAEVKKRGNKSINAKSEVADFAVFLAYNGVDPTVLKGGRKLIGAKYDESYSSDSLNNHLKNFLTSVAKSLNDTNFIKNSSPLTSTELAALVNSGYDLVRTLTEIIRSDANTTSPVTGSGILVDHTGTIKLYPNKEAVLVLYSGSNIVLKAMKNFQTTGRVISEYYMTSYIPCGKALSEPESCRTTGGALYSGATPLDHYKPYWRNLIKNFYTMRSYNTENRLFGEINNVCDGIGGFSYRPQQNNPDINDKQFPINYDIYSIDGKLLFSGVVRNTNEYLNILDNNHQLPSGIYLIRYIDNDKKIQTIKKIKL